MIKFKKIMEKAASQAGASGGMMPLFVGGVSFYRQTGLGESAVLVESPPAGLHIPPTPETESQPLTREVPPPAEGPVSQEPIIGDKLIESVLEQISAGTPETLETAPAAEHPPEGGGEPPEEGVSAEEIAQLTAEPPGEETPPARPRLRAEDSESLIEGMMSDAFSALSELNTTVPEGEVLEQAVSEPGVGSATAAEGAQAIDESFISEVDKLLSTFGTVDSVAGVDRGSGKGGAGARNGRPAESEEEALISEAVRALAQADDKGGAEPSGEADAERETVDVKATPSQDARATTPGEAPGIGKAFDEAPEGTGAQDMKASSVVTKEEKAALLADEEEAEPAVDVNELESDVERGVREVEAEQGGLGAPVGGEAAVEMDFTEFTPGAEETVAGPGTEVEGGDLLSKVLSDLDRLGSVEKPQKESYEEEPKGEEKPEDFSQILSELNAEQASAAQVEADAVTRNAVEVSAAPATEEEIIDEAMRAADETAVEAESTEEREPTEQKKKDSKEPSEEVDELVGGTAAADSEEDADIAETEPSVETAAEEEKAPEAPEQDKAGGQGQKETVEDETTLLANLEASMETAAKQVEEEKKEQPPQKEGTQEDDEDRIRSQVLSRTKEVEQKIIDDVFGEKKDYKAQIKSEMAGIEATKKDAADRGGGGKPGALEKDSHTSFSGTLVESGKAQEALYDGHFGVFWLAYLVNKPFAHRLTPSTLNILGAVAIGLLGTALIWLATAIAKVWLGY